MYAHGLRLSFLASIFTLCQGDKDVTTRSIERKRRTRAALALRLRFDVRVHGHNLELSKRDEAPKVSFIQVRTVRDLEALDGIPLSSP